MVDNVKIARKLGYLEVEDANIISLDEAINRRDREVVIMVTGSQGEPSSILGKLSTSSHRTFDLKPGDTVVLSSHPIPGNEENVSRTINRLFERGAEVIYEPIAPVHVSGHAAQEEMKLMMHLTQPKYFIPIHGELRQLKRHAGLAAEVGIPKQNIAVILNGQPVEFFEGKMRQGKPIPTSYVFVDGSGVGDVGPDVVKEREMLSEEGIIIVNLAIDKFTGKLSRPVELVSKGFIVMRDAEDLMDGLRKRISETAAKANGNLQKDVEQAVSNYLFGETRRRPMVIVNAVKA
jgi:ribonuclease J